MLYGSFKGGAPVKSGLIGTRATRRPKKQSESVSFPPRSSKARERGHPDCGGDCTRRPWPPAGIGKACHCVLTFFYNGT